VNRGTIACVLCIAAVLVALAFSPEVRAQQYSLESVLVGKWRQQYSGLITDTVFTAGHEFVAETVQPGSAYRVYISGTWEIRNSNQLWQHNLRVSPSNLQVQEWEGTEIAVIDANHLRTGSGGDLFRVP